MAEVTFTSSAYGKNFTIVLNNALRDKRLSWRAKGILAGCLTHSENFVFNRDWILEHGTEGRDAVIAALKELRSLGYLQNIKARDEKGCIVGEYYRFSDIPVSPEDADRRPGNQCPENPDAGGDRRTEKPDAGFPGRNRRPIERRPIEKNPPIIPKTTKSSGKGKLVLPEWLEPYRSDLEQWQANRKRAYPKLAPGLTATSIKALEYARSVGVLAEYCSYVSERNWQSLGFIGHQETIDKLAGRNSRNNGRNSTTNPVVYTLT
jgi:hypothetical protein